MKLYKKNKGLLISICTISVVALATVGFSTWILGINDPVKDVDNIKVEIDTHKDRTCALEIKTKDVTPTLKLNENVSKDITNDASTGFGYEFNEQTAAKFDIELEYFNFAFPKTNAEFESIKFTTTFIKEGVVGDPNSPKSNEFGRVGTDLKYIELVTEDINSTNLEDKATLTNVGSYNYYSLNEKILKFKWGNYYVESYGEGKATDSPATYYQLQLDKVNEEFKGKEKLEKQLDVLSKAKTEFEALDKALKGATIKLNISLNVTFND